MFPKVEWHAKETIVVVFKSGIPFLLHLAMEGGGYQTEGGDDDMMLGIEVDYAN